MMTLRERVRRALAHEEADRVPVYDALWATTLARWRAEGLPAGPPEVLFDWDLAGFGGDISLQLPAETLEETADYAITRGPDGAVVRNWRGNSSTPEMLDFAVRTAADWERLKPRMAWHPSRVDWAGTRAAWDDCTARGFFRYASFYTGFTKTCDMCGTETVLIAMLEEPDWVADMVMTRARLCVRVAEEMLARGFDFDAVWLWDDLGFKGRGFFAPELYRALILPAHRLLCDFFHARGLPAILHSCGYVMDLVPLLLETGFDCLQPLEVKASNDILALKRDYGDRLALMGGLDARAIADPDPAVIEAEIAAKVPVLKQGGGYLFHSDHSIPDNVSLAQYRHVRALAAAYGGYG